LGIRQSEELFCDTIGLRLFGESYLYSFLYLIAPNIGDRPNHYPTLAGRVTVLTNACAAFSIQQPPDFQGYFVDPLKSLPGPEAFVLKMADLASSALTSDLISAVDSHIKACGIPLPQEDERDRIVK